MESSGWSGQRIAGLAGVGFVVLLVVTFIFGGTAPVYDDPASDFREFFVDDDTQIHITTWVGALVFVFFFLPFASGLRSLLASADEADGQMWARLSYTGAVLAVAIGAVGSAFWEVLSQGTAEQLSDETLVTLARFDTVIFAGVMPWGLALFLAPASLVIVRSGVIARWIGWAGAAVALLLVVGTLWVFSEDDENALATLVYIALPIAALWVLTVSITMIRSKQPATATAP